MSKLWDIYIYVEYMGLYVCDDVQVFAIHLKLLIKPYMSNY